MTTDTSEWGLEALIVEHMTGRRIAAPPVGGMAEDPEPFIGLHNWLLSDPQDYDREYCVDLAQLTAFLRATQPEAAEEVSMFVRQVHAQNLLVESADAVGGDLSADGPPMYATPTLQAFNDMESLLLLDPIHDVEPDKGWPNGG